MPESSLPVNLQLFMKKIIKPVLFTLLVFFISLIILAPARLIYYALPENSAIQLSGVSGTIWRGRASQLVWQNQVTGKLDWKLKPLHLFIAKFAGDFNISGPDMTINGSVSIDRKQNITLTDTISILNAATLPLPPAAALITPAGKIEAEIKQLKLAGNTIQSTETKIRWKNASVTQPVQVTLGEILLDITSNDGNLKGLLSSSKESPIDLTGNLDIDATGALKTNIKITPTNETPDDILDLLPLLGKPDQNGAVSVKFSGKLTF